MSQVGATDGRADHNLPSPEIVRAIDRALDAGGVLVSLREQGKREQERLRRESAPREAEDRSRASVERGQDVLPFPTAADIDPRVLADALTHSRIDGTAFDHMERAATTTVALSRGGPVGVLAGIAGHLDLDRHSDADRYFDLAGLAALEAESPDLAAWVLAVHSLGPFFRGITGTDFFDAARLDGMAGTTHLLLRWTDHAAPLLRSALERRAHTDVEGRALLALDLAECHLHDDEPDEAARVATTALEWAGNTMVDPILTRAESIRARVVRSIGPAGARSLDARLREAVRD
ncbi:hypothetical protein [Saccharothrix sp. Mg75]|uniref:hypothetical protein n=1 Tax=Saccharothrix sp. Mg75 TaxID=3445357 RepID=UPI003EF00495